MAHDTRSRPTLDEGEAATYIGYRPSALRAWRVQGRGPAYIRHGRSIRYTLTDLDSFIARHRVDTSDSRVGAA